MNQTLLDHFVAEVMPVDILESCKQLFLFLEEEGLSLFEGFCGLEVFLLLVTRLEES